MDVQDCDVYMVGSMAVPSDTVEEAMAIGAEGLGDRLFALPDGEVGLRAIWVAGLGALSYFEHPEIEQVGEDSGWPIIPGPLGALGSCRIKPRVERVSLVGHLPYAPAALSSYEIFKARKAAGELPADLRFEVAVPTPLAAIMPFFGDASEWPSVCSSYQEAITADLQRILAVIPPDELAIQWDYCIELCDICGSAKGTFDMSGQIMPWNPQRSADELFAHHTSAEYIAPLSDGIPDEVVFGYHFCLGTFPSFPTVAVDDLAWVVKIANAVVAVTPHRVDFVHLPAMADSGRSFFSPLAGLDVGGARPFLGIELRDGTDKIVKRGTAAMEFLPDFGISHYCGYGRDDRERIRELLADLRTGADRLAAARAGT